MKKASPPLPQADAPDAAPSRFVRRKSIRFAHCDPAGIVFYPQYFVLINELVEDWFAGVLGVTFAQLHQARRQGVPTVRIECEFCAPSRLGDVVDMTLSVEHVGSSSVGLAVVCDCAGQRRLRGSLTLAFMSLDTARAVPIPDDIRARLPSARTTSHAMTRKAN